MYTSVGRWSEERDRRFTSQLRQNNTWVAWHCQVGRVKCVTTQHFMKCPHHHFTAGVKCHRQLWQIHLSSAVETNLQSTRWFVSRNNMLWQRELTRSAKSWASFKAEKWLATVNYCQKIPTPALTSCFGTPTTFEGRRESQVQTM